MGGESESARVEIGRGRQGLARLGIIRPLRSIVVVCLINH
jgi:hypothetical protein